MASTGTLVVGETDHLIHDGIGHKRYALWITYTVFNVTGVLACSLLIYAVYLLPRPTTSGPGHAHGDRTSADIFVASLCTGCAVMSFACLIQCILSMNLGTFAYGETACELEAFFHFIGMLTEFFSITLGGLRNYLAVVRNKHISDRAAIYIAMGAWALAISGTAITSQYSDPYLMPSGTYCLYTFTSPAFVYFFVPAMGIALVTIIISYWHIFRFSVEHAPPRAIQQQHANNRRGGPSPNRGQSPPNQPRLLTRASSAATTGGTMGTTGNGNNNGGTSPGGGRVVAVAVANNGTAVTASPSSGLTDLQTLNNNGVPITPPTAGSEPSRIAGKKSLYNYVSGQSKDDDGSGSDGNGNGGGNGNGSRGGRGPQSANAGVDDDGPMSPDAGARAPSPHSVGRQSQSMAVGGPISVNMPEHSYSAQENNDGVPGSEADMALRVARRSIMFVVIFVLGWGTAVICSIYEVSYGRASASMDATLAVAGTWHSLMAPLAYGYTNRRVRNALSQKFPCCARLWVGARTRVTELGSQIMSSGQPTVSSAPPHSIEARVLAMSLQRNNWALGAPVNPRPPRGISFSDNSGDQQPNEENVSELQSPLSESQQRQFPNGQSNQGHDIEMEAMRAVHFYGTPEPDLDAIYRHGQAEQLRYNNNNNNNHNNAPNPNNNNTTVYTNATVNGSGVITMEGPPSARSSPGALSNLTTARSDYPNSTPTPGDDDRSRNRTPSTGSSNPSTSHVVIHHQPPQASPQGHGPYGHGPIHRQYIASSNGIVVEPYVAPPHSLASTSGGNTGHSSPRITVPPVSSNLTIIPPPSHANGDIQMIPSAPVTPTSQSMMNIPTPMSHVSIASPVPPSSISSARGPGHHGRTGSTHGGNGSGHGNAPAWPQMSGAGDSGDDS